MVHAPDPHLMLLLAVACCLYYECMLRSMASWSMPLTLT